MNTLDLCELILALLDGGLTWEEVAERIRDAQPGLRVPEADAIRCLIRALDNYRVITQKETA